MAAACHLPDPALHPKACMGENDFFCTTIKMGLNIPSLLASCGLPPSMDPLVSRREKGISGVLPEVSDKLMSPGAQEGRGVA